jgi:hypothetical protein
MQPVPLNFHGAPRLTALDGAEVTTQPVVDARRMPPCETPSESQMTEMVTSGSMSRRRNGAMSFSARATLLALGAAGPARHCAHLRLYQLG